MVPLRARLAAAGCAVTLALIATVTAPAPALFAAEKPAPDTAPAPAADSAALLDAWLARHAGVKTWAADFVQTRTLKTLTQPLTSRGKVRFAAPNRFHWQVGDPPQTIAVRQTNAVLILYPPLKRAERYPLDANTPGTWKQMMTLLEAGFPESRAQLESRFRVVGRRDTAEAHELTLEPRAAAARRLMPRFRVVLGSADFELRATEMEFADGSTLRNDFSHAEFNAPLDEALFNPVLDPGYKVTEPLSGSRP